MSAKACLNCRRESDELKRCSRCQIAWYCNSACQKEAFKTHRKICKVVSCRRESQEAEFRAILSRSEEENGPNPDPEGVYSWNYITKFMKENCREKICASYIRHRCHDGCADACNQNKISVDALDYLRTLMVAAGMESNLEACRAYLVSDWTYRQSFRFVYETSWSHVALSLMALKRWEEAENFLKKIFCDLMTVSYPPTPRGTFYTPEELKKLLKNLHDAPQATESFHGEDGILLRSLVAEFFFLLVCFGAGNLAEGRRAFKDGSETFLDEILNDDSRLKMFRGQGLVVDKILKELEWVSAGRILTWSDRQARILHEINKFVLPAVIYFRDRATKRRLSWETSFRSMSEDFWPPRCDHTIAIPWGFRLCASPWVGNDEDWRRWTADVLVSNTLLFCSLGGFEEVVEEIASRVVS